MNCDLHEYLCARSPESTPATNEASKVKIGDNALELRSDKSSVDLCCLRKLSIIAKRRISISSLRSSQLLTSHLFNEINHKNTLKPLLVKFSIKTLLLRQPLDSFIVAFIIYETREGGDGFFEAEELGEGGITVDAVEV